MLFPNSANSGSMVNLDFPRRVLDHGRSNDVWTPIATSVPLACQDVCFLCGLFWP